MNEQIEQSLKNEKELCDNLLKEIQKTRLSLQMDEMDGDDVTEEMETLQNHKETLEDRLNEIESELDRDS